MESKLAASEKLTQLQELVAANAELLARFAEAFNSFKTEDPRLALVSPEEAGFLFPGVLPIINTIMTLTPEDLGIKRLETRDGNQIPHYTAIEQHYVGPDGKQRSPNIKYLPEHVHTAWQQMNQAYQASLSEDGTTNRGLHIASGYRSPGYQALALTEAINDRGLEIALLNTNLPYNSEHGDPLDTAVDFICLGNENGQKAIHNRPVVFELYREYDWLCQHAADFGFVLSLPPSLEQPESGRTDDGYEFEPWHWRYLGSAEAAHAFNEQHQIAERVAARRRAVAASDYQSLLNTTFQVD
jgi:LAS superfamily LD-carboxypeptidase LdcB